MMTYRIILSSETAAVVSRWLDRIEALSIQWLEEARRCNDVLDQGNRIEAAKLEAAKAEATRKAETPKKSWWRR